MRLKRNNFASMQPSVPSARSNGETWDVRMFTLKNVLSDEALRALCIFRMEVVNQPALHLSRFDRLRVRNSWLRSKMP